MAEPASSATTKTSDGSAPVLLVIILSDPAELDKLITLLLDAGVTGATVLESKGMAAILREDMPIFSGLASLLPERTGSRVIFSVTTREGAAGVFAVLEEELKERERPIALTVPVDASLGLGV